MAPQSGHRPARAPPRTRRRHCSTRAAQTRRTCSGTRHCPLLIARSSAGWRGVRVVSAARCGTRGPRHAGASLAPPPCPPRPAAVACLEARVGSLRGRHGHLHAAATSRAPRRFWRASLPQPDPVIGRLETGTRTARRWRATYAWEHEPLPSSRETTTSSRFPFVRGLFANVSAYRRLDETRCTCPNVTILFGLP
jgi:hypothetical protein